MHDPHDDRPPPLPPFLAAAPRHDADPDTDDAVPVLTDIVTPGRDGRRETPYAAPETPVAEPSAEAGERLRALVHEAVDLALDDALDVLRPELHRRLGAYLEQRLPELVAEALAARRGDE
jgi:hypothetical protein